MKYGARNKVRAKVTGVKEGDVMSQIEFDVDQPCKMASVLTSDSVADLGLKIGDEVTLVVKAIHVLPVKD